MTVDPIHVDKCFLKCRRVIMSCKTLEQFRSAKTYCHLFWRMFFDYDVYLVHRMEVELSRRLRKVMGRKASMF